MKKFKDIEIEKKFRDAVFTEIVLKKISNTQSEVLENEYYLEQKVEDKIDYEPDELVKEF